MAIAAAGLDLPLAEVETARAGEGLERLAAAAPDVLAVVAYGELLPAAVLGLPALAPVNLHFSLLPALRGASPVQSALRLGLERTGVSTIVMDAGLDTGPILLQREVGIRPQDDAGTLGERLAGVGAATLVESVGLLASGEAEPRPQDDAAATYAPKLGPEDRRLDWSLPAASLVNLCRALSPEPGADHPVPWRDAQGPPRGGRGGGRRARPDRGRHAERDRRGDVGGRPAPARRRAGRAQAHVGRRLRQRSAARGRRAARVSAPRDRSPVRRGPSGPREPRPPGRCRPRRTRGAPRSTSSCG